MRLEEVIERDTVLLRRVVEVTQKGEDFQVTERFVGDNENALPVDRFTFTQYGQVVVGVYGPAVIGRRADLIPLIVCALPRSWWERGRFSFGQLHDLGRLNHGGCIRLLILGERLGLWKVDRVSGGVVMSSYSRLFQ